MLRLCLRTLILIIVLSAAIFTARLIGKAQPAPSLFSVIFTNPDGSPCEMPCMFGVRPGKMTSDEAFVILQKHPFVQNVADKKVKELIYGEFKGYIFELPNFSIEISPVSHIDNTVGSIGLTFDISSERDKQTFGDVIATFGPPDVSDDRSPMRCIKCSGLGSIPFMEALYFKGISLSIGYTNTGYILPNDPVLYISAYNPVSVDYNHRGKWRGFGSIEHYPTIF